MSDIRFIVGRPGTGKTYKYLQEIKKTCDLNPIGEPIFVITPEQMTFHTEYQLLLLGEADSLMRVNALSFNRLAYRILQEVGGLSKYHLDDIGKAMILQKIMNAQKEDLGNFTGYYKKPGFIQKMDELFSEFKNYNIDTQNLLEKIDDKSSNLTPQASQKIEKLVKIYQEFKEITLTNYLTTEDYFIHLHNCIKNSHLIKSSDIYIDGYHTFNEQEKLIILQLSQHAKSLTICLTHDPISTSNLFETSARTLDSFITSFSQSKLEYSIETLTTQQRIAPNQHSLLHLEKTFMQTLNQFEHGVVTNEMLNSNSTISNNFNSELTTNSTANQNQNIHPNQGISFFTAPNKRLEIEEVAKRIHHLVHQEGNSYNNIAIYTNSPATSHKLFATILNKYEIPYFLDYKETMINHPVTNLLHKILEVFTSHYQNDKIFTVLKTGLFSDVTNFKQGASYSNFLTNHLEKIDILENYVLARNIKKRNWISDETWEYSKYSRLATSKTKTEAEIELQEQLNKIKTQIMTPLINLENQLNQSKTFQDFATAIFQFLEELNIPQKLHLLAQNATEQSDLKSKKQHEQIWNKILSLFEQIVEVGAKEEINLYDFNKILQSGLEQMTYATVPPSLDQVQIGDIKRSRYQLATNFSHNRQYGLKHAFVIGINEGEIPAVGSESSLLTENERQELAKLDIQLAPSLVQNQIDEIFSLYTALTSASNTMTLSYAGTTDEKEHDPSHIFTTIKNIYPQIPLKKNTPNEALDLYQNLTTEEALYASLIFDLKKSPHLKNYYQPILNYFQQHDVLKFDIIAKALGYTNKADSLDQNLTKELYNEHIEASVSRIELFNNCEFAHFIRYGLKLEEREKYELRSLDIGNVYHEALKEISILLKRENRSFASITNEEAMNLVNLGIEGSNSDFMLQMLEASVRMKTLKSKLAKVLYKTLLTLREQGRNSGFKEVYFELPFSKDAKSGIRTVARQVDGFSFSLKGIIDRVDVAEAAGNNYLRVVDYKSGKKELELDSVYYGLSLQLLTYLDVAVNGVKDINDVGGALYFQVHSPYVSHDEEILSEENCEEFVTDKQAAQYKMSGYLPADYDACLISDKKLLEDGTGKSTIVPVALKKDGNFSAIGNRVLATDDFQLLMDFAKHKTEESVKKMSGGSIDINPSKHKSQTSCGFCQYKSICKFDSSSEFHTYKSQPKLKNEVVLDAIKKELEV